MYAVRQSDVWAVVEVSNLCDVEPLRMRLTWIVDPIRVQPQLTRKAAALAKPTGEADGEAVYD